MLSRLQPTDSPSLCGVSQTYRLLTGSCFMHCIIRILLLITLIQLLSIAASHAQPRATVPLAAYTNVIDAPAQPTAAWTQFCEQTPGECLVDTSEPTVIHLTPEIWERAVAVNAWVNGNVRPLSDQDHWGTEDRWDYPADGAGDCEDFQLLKRKLLVAVGFPHRTLRMTVVLDELGAGHAVLMMRTDRGDFILDNKVSDVLPWYETGYHFLKREPTEGRNWVALGSPITTATMSSP